MRHFRFVDGNRQIVNIYVDFREYIFFSGTVGDYYGQIVDHIKPASPIQERLVHLWKRHHLTPFDKKVRTEIIKMERELVDKNSKERNEFVEEKVRGNVLRFLINNVDAIGGDRELAMKVEAAFEFASGFHYQRIEQIDLVIKDKNTIEIGGCSYFVFELSRIKEFVLECIRGGYGHELWKYLVERNETELGFADWCEIACKDADLIKGIDKYYRSKNTVSVGGNVYFVGARQIKI